MLGEAVVDDVSTDDQASTIGGVSTINGASTTQFEGPDCVFEGEGVLVKFLLEGFSLLSGGLFCTPFSKMVVGEAMAIAKILPWKREFNQKLFVAYGANSCGLKEAFPS